MIGSDEMDDMRERDELRERSRKDGFIEGYMAAYADGGNDHTAARRQHIWGLANEAWRRSQKTAGGAE